MTQAERDQTMADVTGTQLHETDDAWCVEIVRMGEKGPAEVWLPKSCCEKQDDYTWQVPEWLADKERLI